jgi:PAS domain S-box-containing protein
MAVGISESASKDQLFDVRLLLDSSGDGLYGIDTHGRCTLANRVAAELFGYTPAELVGQPVDELLHHSRPDGTPHPHTVCPIQRTLETGRGVGVDDDVFWHKDGSGVCVAYSCRPVVENGVTIGAVVAVRDIRDRKRAERERRRLLEQIDKERFKLDGIVDSMSDGLLLMDSDRRISYSNRRAGELLRIEHTSLMGKRDVEAFTEVAHLYENAATAWATWEEAMTRLDERPCFDLRVSGDPQPDLQLRLFRVPGGPDTGDGIGLVLRDVSAERRLVRAKDDFIAAISHELASPATNLVSYAEMLSSQVYPEPDRREMLATMVQEGRRLTAIIRDFVDVLCVQQGRLTVRIRPTDMRTLLQHIANIARTDTAHTLVVDIPEQLPLVQADPDRIQQVLANLVSNAQKYTPRGRYIQLSARLLESSVEVAVADQGLGIPADALPRVFEKFYRVDAEDRRNIKGTGLGLAIVKDLVEAQAGEVGVSSEGPGKGACFWFRLPLATPNIRFVLASGSVGISVLEARQRGVDAVLSKPYCPADLGSMLQGVAHLPPRAEAA